MKNYFTILFTVFLLYSTKVAQSTFSICAVDPVTGEVGSAGATCITNCVIISDVHPGIGVIHTQALWNSTNQMYAGMLMSMGLSPQHIIDSLILHDAQGNPTIRQYGIVDLIGGGRSAAYTGVNCFDYKNHIVGPTYSIQGNILLGQQILDSMQSRFLNTPGRIEFKLMAALQGAKVVGADIRCTGLQKSSISAYLRVAKPQDTIGILYINLAVNNTPTITDPIDSLQTLFNKLVPVELSGYASEPAGYNLSQNYPNPFNPVTIINYDLPRQGRVKIKLIDISGREIHTLIDEIKSAGHYTVEFNAIAFASGIYFYRMEAEDFEDTKRMILLK